MIRYSCTVPNNNGIRLHESQNLSFVDEKSFLFYKEIVLEAHELSIIKVIMETYFSLKKSMRIFL